MADRIVKLMCEPFEIEGQQIVIGASAGIALAPDDGESADLLLKNADMALYRAKEDGRRTFRFFERGMDARMRARRVLELDLRNALAASEFELYYQPLVNLETGSSRASRRCCAGFTPSVGSSSRRNSFRWPRRSA